MITILNEEEYAQSLLENGWVDRKRGQALYILSKHYRFKENLTPSETKAKLIEFCKKNMNDYYTSDMYINLNKAIKSAYSDKTFFIEVDNINIYQYEIDYINNLDISKDDKRLLFVIMCITKITQLIVTRNNDNYWTSNDPKFRNLRKIGNFNVKYNVYEGLHRLVNKGIISVSDYKNTIQSIFMNDIEINDNSECFVFDDFNNVGYWWDKFVLNDKNIIRCVCCRNLIKRKSNRQVLCKECSADLVKAYKSEWYKQRRQNFLKNKKFF